MKRMHLVIALALLTTLHTYSQMRQKIAYQGLLTTSVGGTPLADGSYNMEFDIYNLPTGGTVRYADTLSGVQLTHGTFSVELGPMPPIFIESLYVQVTVLSGPGIGSPETFSPRTALTSSPYSLAPWVPHGNDVYFSTGNVGVGTSNPNYKLEVNGIINATDIYKNGSPFTGSSQWTTTGADIYFSTGKVGIGTTSPLSQLHIKGNNPVRILGDLATLTGSEYVDFMAHTSTYGSDLGGMRVQRDTVTGDVNTSIYAAKSGFVASEKFRVAGNGNIGIGTSSPNYKLHVYGVPEGISIQGLSSIPYNTAYMSFRNGSGTRIGYVGDGSSNDDDIYLGSDVGNVSLITSGGVALTASGSGNVGVGTKTPGYPLTVVASSGTAMSIQGSGAGDAYGLNIYVGGSSSGVHEGIYCYSTGSSYGNTGYFGYGVGGTYANGVVGQAGGATYNWAGYYYGDIGYTGSLVHNSDAKFKENIQTCSGVLSQLMQVTPRTFNYRSTAEYKQFSFSPGKHYGFIAQELEQVFPDIVENTGQDSPRDPQGHPVGKPTQFKAVKETELIPILVSAIQEQQKMIEQLQAEVSQLKKK